MKRLLILMIICFSALSLAKCGCDIEEIDVIETKDEIHSPDMNNSIEEFKVDEIKGVEERDLVNTEDIAKQNKGFFSSLIDFFKNLF